MIKSLKTIFNSYVRNLKDDRVAFETAGYATTGAAMMVPVVGAAMYGLGYLMSVPGDGKGTLGLKFMRAAQAGLAVGATAAGATMGWMAGAGILGVAGGAAAGLLLGAPMVLGAALIAGYTAAYYVPRRIAKLFPDRKKPTN